MNNGDKNVTGSFARNRFGRNMAQKGSGDTSYYALMVGCPAVWPPTTALRTRTSGRTPGGVVLRRQN